MRVPCALIGLMTGIAALSRPPVLVGQWRAPSTAISSPRDSVYALVIPPTHWREGAIIGAAVVGATGAWAGRELCHFSDNRSNCDAGAPLAGGLVGGVLGGIVGALIGGAVPAQHARPRGGQPLRSTLIGAGAGALWSFGLFFPFCVDGCRSTDVRFGLSISGVGALAGFLVGQ